MHSSCTRGLVLLGIFCAAVVPALAQAPADTNPPVGEPLQINVRNVLVDVVVTDKKGTAVPGLHKEAPETHSRCGKPLVIASQFPKQTPLAWT